VDGAQNVNDRPHGFKIIHRQKDGTEREIDRNAVDYGDGTVMVQYVDDNGGIAIVSKSEIINVPIGIGTTDSKDNEGKS
jgi:hypothetical protein